MSRNNVKESAMKAAISKGNLGLYLRLCRESKGLTQGDVAKLLKLSQFQSISQWERNATGSVPMDTLHRLIQIYHIPEQEVYEVLLKYSLRKAEEKLEKKFFGERKSSDFG